ncbi:response regulator [Paenibacillus abyssi]|uniref:DNA-binding response regulator n=1 Tax=Paenibacillus abyssi TaxID=1340531 RepID=A0A917FV40_9BACL|nr:response regulator transcription factor [Paenibacillus abyssi]GGG03476.1 DNA-binding response regulator [Paenibacillus abyssi]
MEPLRLVIVDDQRLFRENLKTVIEIRIKAAKVVGIAGNGIEALRVIKETQPNLILMDMRMPMMDGVECIKHLRADGNETKVIVLTTFDDDQYLFEALQYGVAGYLLKDIEPEELTNAILQVQEGGTLISPQMTTKIVDEVTRRRRADRAVSKNDLSRLTQRELEVLKHLGLGEDNREIARSLHLAEGTVRNHVSSIYEKLELKDRAHAIRYAILSGVIG